MAIGTWFSFMNFVSSSTAAAIVTIILLLLTIVCAMMISDRNDGIAEKVRDAQVKVDTDRAVESLKREREDDREELRRLRRSHT
jgi:flagellar biosynthesis/type III secretory pathway M-ring protein FliF/YscJ